MKGGARPGAGRKATGRTTKVVRVNSELSWMATDEKLQGILDLYETWKQEINKHDPKTPRWEKCYQLLKDLEKAIYD